MERRFDKGEITFLIALSPYYRNYAVCWGSQRLRQGDFKQTALYLYFINV